MARLRFICVVAVLASLCPLACTSSSARHPRASAAVVPSRASILSIMRKACGYQLEKQARTPFTNGWVRSAFYTGVMAIYDASHDPKYLDAAVRWSEEGQWTPTGKDLRFADNQACAQVYCELYFIKPDPKRIAPSKAIFDAQIVAPKPGREEWWWCDSLFMAPPALARMYQATGDPKYIDFLSKMWWDTTDFLYDQNAHLFYRDSTYFDKKTADGQKVFWSRGNGWVMAGTARVIEYLPTDFPTRDKFVHLYRDMASAIIKLQGADGLWRSSLLDPKQFPSPETSGSGFFCYALAWGINHDLLDRATYLPVVARAWNGLVSKVNSDGKLGYVQKVAGGPGKVKPGDTQEYAVGAFLLAGREMLKLSGPSR